MPSASMQVLEWEPVPEPAATVYTFMGLATLPRLRGGSSLRLLPLPLVLGLELRRGFQGFPEA